MTCQSQYWFPDPSKTLWECAETWLGEQTESSSYSVSDTQWFFCNYLPSPLICWIAWQCSVVDGFRNGSQHGCAGSYLRHDNHDSHDGCLALCPGVHHETDAQQPERLSVDLGVSGCVASHGSTSSSQDSFPSRYLALTFRLEVCFCGGPHKKQQNPLDFLFICSFIIMRQVPENRRWGQSVTVCAAVDEDTGLEIQSLERPRWWMCGEQINGGRTGGTRPAGKQPW